MKKPFFSADEKQLQKHANYNIGEDVDVSRLVMSRIYEQKKKKFLFVTKPVAALFLSSIVLLTGAATFATGLWELTNKDGEVLLEAEKLNGLSYVVERFNHPVNEVKTTEQLEVEQMIMNVRETLEPGTYAYVYVNDEDLNPEQKVVEVIKQEYFTDYELFSTTVAEHNFPTNVTVPKHVGIEYQFVKGSYSMLHKTPIDYEQTVKELKQKALNSDELLLVEVRPISETYTNIPGSIHVTLSNGTSEIYYWIKYEDGLKHFVSNDAIVEKIQLTEELQAFYIEDDAKTVKLAKIENGVRTSYSVSFSIEDSLSKEDIIKVAQNLLK